MIVLIVAGGSGSRLWPLSVPEYPKHLLKVVGERSLLQATFDRALKLTTPDKIYISTETSHAHHVEEQLPELAAHHHIVEPARKGTMPCILNALQFISKHHDHDEPIASVHADHYIRDEEGFADGLEYAAQISKKHGRLTLVGAEPDHPATNFGYIQKGELVNGDDFAYDIKTFKEKPEFAIAKEYVDSGNFYWNMGYFVAPYNVFLEKISSSADSHWSKQIERLERASDEEREKIYLEFQDEVIETALIEKVKDLIVVSGTFDWMDVGGYNDIHKATSQDEQENSSIGNNIILDSHNVYVRNDEEKPLAVIGLDNVAVVNTKHGILVVRKDLSQRVKDIAKEVADK